MTPTGPLFWIFVLANLITFFWLVIVGFRRHWGWGLAVFFVPFALLVFAIMYWEDAKKPFLLYVVTTVVLVYQVVSFTKSQGEAMMEIAQQGVQPSVFGDSSEIDQARQVADIAMQQIEQMHRAGLISDAELAQLREEYERDMAALGGRSDYRESDADVVASSVEEGDFAAEVVEAVPAPEPQIHDAPAERATEAETTVAKAAPAQPKPKVKKRRIGKIDVSEASRYIGRQVIVTDKSGRTRLATLSGSSPGQLEFQRRMRTGAMTFQVYKSDITNLVLK